LREYREAIRLNPRSFDAHYLCARTCFQSGRLEEAVEMYRRGAEVRPEDFQCSILAELPLRRLGRLEEAAETLREGMRRIERQLELEPDNVRALSLGASMLMVEGRREQAVDWMERAIAGARDSPLIFINAACMYAQAGMKEEALACLEKCFARGVGKRDWIENDPDYDSLRDDPRFQALLAKLS
jgi:adenylate cyclase